MSEPIMIVLLMDRLLQLLMDSLVVFVDRSSLECCHSRRVVLWNALFVGLIRGSVSRIFPAIQLFLQMQQPSYVDDWIPM